jgi:hypothetical protein
MIDSLFLDTSILVALTVKGPVLSEVTADACDRRKWFVGAAEYAILEYHNAVIRRIGFLLKLLDRYRHVTKVRQHIDLVTAASHYGRQAQISREIMYKVEFSLEEDFDPVFPRTAGDDFQEARAEAASVYLKGFRRAWLRKLRSLADHWTKGTNCHWVRVLESTRGRGNIQVECSRRHIDCHLVSYLNASDSKLAALESGIAALAPTERTSELDALARALANFRRDPESAAEYRTGCRLFADALHVLEAHAFSTVYSMNYKEFGPLCKALGKNFLFQDHRGNPPEVRSPA